MKKFVLCVIVLLITASAFAGSGFAGFGPRFGLNIANVRGDSIPDECKSKMAFNFGVFATYNINEFIGIQPEIMFTMKGSNAKYEYAAESYCTYKLNLNYIEIPILAKLTIPLGAVRPYVLAGPEFAVDVGATYSSDFEGVWAPESESGDVEDASAMDFGLMFGCGVAFEVGPGFLSLDARYDMGFLSIYDRPNDAWNANDAYNEYNNCLSVNLGYAFGK